MRYFLMLWITALGAVALAVLVPPPAAIAQIPSKLLPQGITSPDTQPLPAGVRRVGNVEVAPVTFNARDLFDVTGPIIRDRKEPGNQIPVEIRSAQIEENLRYVLIEDPNRSESLFGAYDTYYDPESFSVVVERVGGHPVLVAGDRAHPNDLSLLTVTERDARYYGASTDELARRWRGTLQDALVRALASRQPAVVGRHLQFLPKLLGAVVIISAALWFARRRLGKWRASLQLAGPSDARDRERVERDLAVVALLDWLTAVVFILIWVGAVLWTLALFPGTAWIPERLWRQLLAIAVIWVVAGLVDRLANVMIRRLADVWGNVQTLTTEDNSRRPRRIPTIVGATQGVKSVVVYSIAIGATLEALGLPTVPLLTLGAVLGLAVSLAAQSIIKDFTNGLLILTEDQFAVGDFIWVGDVGGVVERLTLRATQVRQINGRLTTIPNSQISIVQNAARDWARMDATVEVAYGADVDRALAMIAEVAEALYRDATWSASILEPPHVLGVETMSHTGVGIRVWITTLPMHQARVQREFNRRVDRALQEQGISIGIPHLIVGREPSDGRDDAGAGSSATGPDTTGEHERHSGVER